MQNDNTPMPGVDRKGGVEDNTSNSIIEEIVMLKLFSPLAIGGAFASLTFLGAAPALAGSPVTFVSGKGTDSGNCADPAHPCHSFQFALGQTSAGGEIKALDPAHYGRVTIDKSVSITGVEGAGRTLNIATDAITINAQPTDTINLSHLILDGVKTAQNGIVLNSGGSLTITHCTVRNFKITGIYIHTTDQSRFLIADVTVSDNGTGINVFTQGTGTAKGTLEHVSAHRNGGGIDVAGLAKVLAVDSTAANNTFEGFFVGSQAVLRLAHSAATGNGTGVRIDTGATAESAGDNFIAGNGFGTDVIPPGTLKNVHTQ
ncbi:MAG: right-handed parallel beta-helix repeat-containing protein [Pseudomonadota bacterium]|nr:right-handed parallel beta-helix repeat-containing protein [Pseudomonadota bacterium]